MVATVLRCTLGDIASTAYSTAVIADRTRTRTGIECYGIATNDEAVPDNHIPDFWWITVHGQRTDCYHHVIRTPWRRFIAVGETGNSSSNPGIIAYSENGWTGYLQAYPTVHLRSGVLPRTARAPLQWGAKAQSSTAQLHGAPGQRRHTQEPPISFFSVRLPPTVHVTSPSVDPRLSSCRFRR